VISSLRHPDPSIGQSTVIGAFRAADAIRFVNSPSGPALTSIAPFELVVSPPRLSQFRQKYGVYASGIPSKPIFLVANECHLETPHVFKPQLPASPSVRYRKATRSISAPSHVDRLAILITRYSTSQSRPLNLRHCWFRDGLPDARGHPFAGPVKQRNPSRPISALNFGPRARNLHHPIAKRYSHTDQNLRLCFITVPPL
jgi:hypothetical protein